MTDAEIIELLGGITAVARMLEIKPPSVHHWLTEGIPEGRLRELAGQIELRSNGRFSRRERWPEKYAFYWPELAQAKAEYAQPASKVVAEAQVAIRHVEAVAVAEIKHVAEAQAAVKTEVKDVDPPVKLPPPASTEVADSLKLDERRKGLPTRRRKKQPFTGPDKRVGPPDRRGFKLPEVTAALPKGV